MPMLYLGIGLVVFGLLVVGGGLFARSKGKRILSAPLRKTGEAPQLRGPVSFEGTTLTHQPLVAPCSSTPCVYFHLKIEKKVKEKRGGNSTTSWKLHADQHYGSMFALDDGSGPVMVQAIDPVDADLTKTYAGPPPGGHGLGALANFITKASFDNGEVLEYRVTERIIPVNAKLFALGDLQNGTLQKPASKKLIVSTRGRAALLGATRKLSIGLFAFGSAVLAAGAVVMIVKPGEAPACSSSLKGLQSECVVSTTIVDKTDIDKKPYKIHEHVYEWTVEKAGKYQLVAHPLPREKRSLYPTLQVEDKFGLPVNVGLNFGIGKSSDTYKTKTKHLEPGTYKVYVWSLAEGPDQLILSINDAPATDSTAEK